MKYINFILITHLIPNLWLPSKWLGLSTSSTVWPFLRVPIIFHLCVLEGTPKSVHHPQRRAQSPPHGTLTVVSATKLSTSPHLVSAHTIPPARGGLFPPPPRGCLSFQCSVLVPLIPEGGSDGPGSRSPLCSGRTHAAARTVHLILSIWTLSLLILSYVSLILPTRF